MHWLNLQVFIFFNLCWSGNHEILFTFRHLETRGDILLGRFYLGYMHETRIYQWSAARGINTGIHGWHDYLLRTMLSNNSRFLRYATYSSSVSSVFFFSSSRRPPSLSLSLTPASTLAGLEQFGSANSETIEISTPVKMIESYDSLSFCYSFDTHFRQTDPKTKSHGMDVCVNKYYSLAFPYPSLFTCVGFHRS